MYLQVLGFHNNQKLMQYSWNYMNDSLRTDVFVRYQPETVACACIYLTSRKLRLPLPKNPHWYTIFGATEKSIRDICVKILKLYSRPKPNIEDLEKQVCALCEKYKEIRAKAKGVSGNNSPSNDQNSQKTSAHNAWGGFISRSGSHMPPPVNEKRSRSRSETRSPDRRHHKKSKKHRSRTRSPRNHKKSHKRKSYSRSRSNSPHKVRKTRDRKRSKSPSNDRYIDRHDDKDRKYKDDRESKHRERDKESRYDKYEDKKDRESKKYDREEKHKDREDKYKDREDKYRERDDKYKERDDKYKEREDKYKEEKYSSKEHKKSKYRDEERSETRTKDRRRRS